MKHLIMAVLAALLVAGCGGGGGGVVGGTETPAQPSGQNQKFPEIVDVEVEKTGDTFSFKVTVSSPYDTPERYADGWRVKGPDGTVYGEHTLAHDHADEQPFTREQTGVKIPDGVEKVVVEGRDKANGYGGKGKEIALP